MGAKEEVAGVLAEIPAANYVITCGDFNTRTGTRAPTIRDTTLVRQSQDGRTCHRAPWLMQQCELTEQHILNGKQPGEHARYTCHTGKG